MERGRGLRAQGLAAGERAGRGHEAPGAPHGGAGGAAAPAGRRVDRRFYSGRLLPGALRGRAGRRAACAYVLLRNSFSGKWGSFAQQRLLALSSVRRLQQPPST